METYTFNDQIYTREDLEGVAQRKGYTFEELLQKNPSIKPTSLGNQPGVANETATVTPLQKAVAGGYRPVGISLDSQNVAPLKSRAELEEEEEKRQEAINAALSETGGVSMYNYGGSGGAILPPGVIKRGISFLGSTLELIRTIPEYLDAKAQVELEATGGLPTNLTTLHIQANNIIKRIIRGDSEEQVSNEGLIDTSGWRNFNEKLLSVNKKYFNDDGTEADFQELAAQGRSEEATEKLISDAFVAMPSLAVSLFGGPYGIAALGISAAGSSFERTMRENPEENLAKAFFISNIQGGIEAGSEWAGARLLKGLSIGAKLMSGGKIVSKGANKKVVDEFIKNTSDNFLQKAFRFTGKTGAGMLFEGGTEGGANILNETIQEIAYSGKEWSDIDHGRIWTKALNEFAVGAVLGGGASIITQNLNKNGLTEQNVAMHIAPQSRKMDIFRLMREEHYLENKVETAKTKKEKTKFEKQLKEKTKEIADAKAELVEDFNNLSTTEKRNYAEMLDKNQQLYDDLYKDETLTTNQEKTQIRKEIGENFENMNNVFNKFGLDPSIEAFITNNIKLKEKNVAKLEESFRDKKIKGLKVEILDTQKKIDEAAKKYKGFDPNADGMFISKASQTEPSKILINKDVAAATGETSVLGHEKLHFLLSKYFKTDNKSIKPLVDSFKQYLRDSGLAEGTNDNNNILQRIEQRFNDNYVDKKTGEIQEGALEEYFTIFSDLIAKEKLDIVEEKGIASKLAKAYTNTMQGLGFASVKLNTGKDVFDFIRNYTKNIQKSDAILGVKLESDKILKGISGAEATRLSKTKPTAQENEIEFEARLNRDFPKATKEQIDAQLRLLRSPSTRFREKAIEEAKKSGREFRITELGDVVYIEGGPFANKEKKERLEEARKISGVKFSKSTGKDIDAAYTEGKSAFEIALMFEPLVTKIANQRYKTAPDFNAFREDLIQNSLLEKGGVIDLINSYKEGTGTLSGYINQTVRVDKKTGEKISLLKSRMDGIASKLFGEKFTEDVTERVDIAAPETAPVEITTTETPLTRNVIDRLNLSPSLANVGKTAITKGLATVGATVPLNKGFTFRENLKRNVKNSMYDAVKKELGGSNIKEYINWVEQNAEEIYNIIPLGDLVKNKPLTDKFVIRPVDKQGRQLRKLETFSGKKTYAGNLVFEKKPWSPQVKKDFIAEFTQGRNAKETRRLFLTNTIAKEIAFDQALEVIKDPTVLEKVAVTQPQEVMKNFTEELSRQVERGQFIKYSKSKALDNWIVDSTQTGDTSIISRINNEIYDVVKTMQPTGKYRHNIDLQFGTAFVKHFNPLSKYTKEIEKDLNKLWMEKIAITKGSFKLKGQIVRPLVGGLLRPSSIQNDRAYDYVSHRFTGTVQHSKEFNNKTRTNKYEPMLKLFASEYLTEGDLNTYSLKEAMKQLTGFKDMGKQEEFFNISEKTNLVDGKERKMERLSSFAGKKEVSKYGIQNKIESLYTGNKESFNEHNKNINEIVRPQNKRIMLSLYDFVQNSKGTPNEQDAIAFAIRFHTMFFRGDTKAPIREQAFIAYVAKDIKTPYAEHAKQIETLGEDFFIDQDGDNLLAAYLTGGKKGRQILERAIDKLNKSNGVFIMDESQSKGGKKFPNSMDSLHGKVGIPNKNFITSRLQGVVSEGDMIPIESGLALSEGDLYNLNKGLNANVIEAKMIDKDNNEMYIKFSKTRSKPAQLADMIDRKSEGAKTIKSAKDLAIAKKLGQIQERKFYGNDWNLFLPYSAEDFYGLIQKMAGKGKQGDIDLKFLKENLLDTYSQGIADLETDRRSMFNSYRELKDRIKDSPFKLREKLKEKGLESFTIEDAVRVFIWQQSNHEIPELSVTKAGKMAEIVSKNKDLRSFAFGLMSAMKTDGYPKPTNNWIAGRLGTDFAQSINQTKRPKYLKKWQTNVDLLLNDKNKAKLTAAFGASYVKNLEDTIKRMKSGVNRKPSNSYATNITQDFINGSVGTIMSFNMRSATLQSISAINYMNWSDNNPIMIAKALANPKQFAKDFIYLLNSDYLTNRRQGLKINVQEAEIAEAARSKNPVRAVIGHMLKIGFLPTQIMDSVAIASGGSSFYRNRINTYIKQGLTQQKAEEKAYQEWRQISNEAQQSSDPSRISNVQASNYGRVVFAFANTPMQYMRLTKKAASDLINRRGDDKTNISKIVYYTAVQNIIFNTLQNALFFADFGEDEEFYEGRRLTNKAKAKRREFKKGKEERTINGMADSVLRGLGYGGALMSMLKNAGMSYYKEQQKENEFYKDWTNVLLSITDIVPPIDHKARKLKAIIEAGKYDSDISPSLEAAINALSLVNIPADRMHKKLQNLRGVADTDLDIWVRIAMFLGWSDWELGVNKK